MKRLFDIAISVVLLTILAIPVGTVMILIRLGSPGPAIFRQVRVGRNGAPFTCLTLRTMRAGVAQTPTHEAKAGDITALGRFLRKIKLDEVPQLINVIAGDMSLVGPRPRLPTQHQLVEARRLRGVLALRPGITGIAQVAGVDMSAPERLAELDAHYIGRDNLITDIKLLFATVSPKALADRIVESADKTTEAKS